MIRRATRDDLPQVNLMRAEVASMHSAARPDIFHDVPPEARLIPMQATSLEMLADENKDLIVWDEGETIAGFVCADYVIRPANAYAPEQRYCYVKELGVGEAFRNQGIARKLMQWVQAEARRRKLNRVELDVWAFNEGAVSLYESLGFKTRYCYMELDIENAADH
ncbi:MAG: GNAT family N-acetyltransferase [Clostridia bacterium]|nr:GNAT family N-acetyltransferase [Clostridia bacterium]